MKWIIVHQSVEIGDGLKHLS
jgi:hypothetical protein